MNPPLVTIGIPVFNDYKIFDCLNVVLKQKYEYLQIIILDNFSDIKFRDKLKEFVKNKNIELVINKENLGSIYSHNKLLDLAKGKYFMWLHSDDRISKNFILESVNLLEKNETILGVIGKIFLFDFKKKKIIKKYPEPKNLEKKYFLRTKYYLKDYNNDILMNCMFRLKKLPKLYNCISAEAVFIFEILKRGQIYGHKNIIFYKDGTTYITARPTKELFKHYDPKSKLNSKYIWLLKSISVFINSGDTLFNKIKLICILIIYNAPITRNFFKSKNIIKND